MMVLALGVTLLSACLLVVGAVEGIARRDEAMFWGSALTGLSLVAMATVGVLFI